MNNEIKEILDYLKDDKWDYYPCDGVPYKAFLMEERDKLLDYITNLQEENERLSVELNFLKQLIPNNKKWLEEGFNHKIVPANNKFDHQHIYREFNDEIWCIKINSLEELLELQDKYGDIVLSTCFKNNNIRELEIYDDYRE